MRVAKRIAKCRGQTGATARQAPQNHSGTDDDPARESISEQAENRGTNHVSDEECVAEQPSLGHGVYVAGREKSGANIGLERGQNLPVDVIEKIDRQEQKECGMRAAHRFFPKRSHCNCRLQFARRRL